MSLWADEGCSASEDIAPTFKMANAHVLPTTEEQWEQSLSFIFYFLFMFRIHFFIPVNQ